MENTAMITAVIISFLAFAAWVESYAIRQKYKQLIQTIHAQVGSADAVFRLPKANQYWMNSIK